MRLSSEQGHPDYHPILSPWCAVYLDGVRMKGATVADEENGFVTVDSRLYGYQMPNGELQFGIVVLKGNVRIEVPDYAPQPAQDTLKLIRDGLIEGHTYGPFTDTGLSEGKAGEAS